MSVESLKCEIIICSKCGRKLTSFKDRLNDKENTCICDLCYQHMMFPDFRNYDCEILDYSNFPGEI